MPAFVNLIMIPRELFRFTRKLPVLRKRHFGFDTLQLLNVYLSRNSEDEKKEDATMGELCFRVQVLSKCTRVSKIGRRCACVGAHPTGFVLTVDTPLTPVALLHRAARYAAASVFHGKSKRGVSRWDGK